MAYAIGRGDVVWVSLDSQVGHEQSGRRPALVISPKTYNERTSLALLCPITNQKKGYPFEVLIPTDQVITGVILADQLKNIDWRARDAEFVVRLPLEIVDEVLDKISTLLTTE